MSRTRHPRRRPGSRDPSRHHIKDAHGSDFRYPNHGASREKDQGIPRTLRPAERRIDGDD